MGKMVVNPREAVQMARVLLSFPCSLCHSKMKMRDINGNGYKTVAGYDEEEEERTEKKRKKKRNAFAAKDVPKGRCAVYVGSQRLRYVIPTSLLHHNLLRKLLQKSEQEYGLDHPFGLFIPCDDLSFHTFLSCHS